jgi:hypothetical protein
MKTLPSLAGWTSLCLVAFPGSCLGSYRSKEDVIRKEFVRAMDQAIGHHSQQKESILSRLAEIATPVHAFPNYAPTTSSSFKSSKMNRNLEDYEQYGLNLTQYALKYVGCSNIKTWSDEQAQTGYSVLKTERFVVLRLCPRDSCSNYNKYGCLEKFGDYLIPMESYLQIMAETFFTQYQEYCETCYECMTGQQANYGGRRLDETAAGDDYTDDANGDDAVNAEANDEYYNNCDMAAACENYKTACQDYTNLGFDLQAYFECAAFNIGGGVGYLGPHCGTDGKTISVSVFSDENCNNFKAELKDMSSYVQFSNTELEAYTSDNCISCLASVSHFQCVVSVC